MEKALIQADLNLLKVLQVLLEERNVTRTADRLYVSQPAISKSLRRLREMFDDPLLVRSPHGLVPTARALELELPLREAIARLEGLWKPLPFDPAQSQGTLRIAVPESFILGISSRLVLKLRDVAPRLSIEFLPLPDNFVAMLAGGSLDFVVYLAQQYGEGIVTTPLLIEELALWFSESHPLNRKQDITLEDICSYPIIRFHSANTTKEATQEVDLAVAKARLKLTDFMSTGHFLIALDVLAKSNAIMAAPQHLSQLPGFVSGIVSRSASHLPIFKKARLHLALIQHDRTVTSPLHKWIADEIQKGFATVAPVRQRKGHAPPRNN